MSGTSRVVMVDGPSYPVQGPYMWYLGRAAEGEGLEVDVISPDDGVPGGAGNPLVVAHGVDGHWASLVAESKNPAVLLCPKLDEADVAEAIAAIEAPGLVVGSIGDRHWNRVAAARFRHVEVLQLPQGDHLLDVPGDPIASLTILTRVVERFTALVRGVR